MRMCAYVRSQRDVECWHDNNAEVYERGPTVLMFVIAVELDAIYKHCNRCTLPFIIHSVCRRVLALMRIGRNTVATLECYYTGLSEVYTVWHGYFRHIVRSAND